MTQPCAVERLIRGHLHALQNVPFVDRQHPVVLHQDFAADHRHAHVAGIREAGDAMNRHIHRHEVRLEQVDQNDVGLLAHFERTELVVKRQRLGGIDRDHFEHLAVRQDVRVTKMTTVVMHALPHVAEHVVAPIGRRAI